MPLVSICIPTYSAQRLGYLREAVESGRAQTHKHIEIIISDNGNDPPIRALAEEQMRLDSRVRYRKNEPPVSAAANFSAVANESRGDYVVWIGDDDRLLPRCVETLLGARGQDTTVVFSGHYLIDATGQRLEEATRQASVTFARDRLPAGPVADPVASAWRQSMSLIGALFRTADLRGRGLRTDLRTGDFEFFVRLANEGSSFVYVPEFLFEYRTHPGAWTSSNALDEGLIDVLEPIPVPPRLEPLKRALMARILLGSVNAALKAGNVPQARAMIRNPYYPSLREGAARVFVQRALAHLPGPVARSFFEIMPSRARSLSARLRRDVSAAKSRRAKRKRGP